MTKITNGEIITKNYLLSAIIPSVQDEFTEKWRDKVNSDIGTSRKGGNKLRCYKLFKQDFKTELYVSIPMPRSHRSALAKFRSGTAPLQMETGRYEGMPIQERICPLCQQEIETEMHCLLICNKLDDFRQPLLDYVSRICDIDIQFNDMQHIDQFKYLMSSGNACIVRKVAKTCFSLLKQRRLLLNAK